MEYYGDFDDKYLPTDLMFAIADILNLDAFDGTLTVIQGYADDNTYGECYHDDLDVTINLTLNKTDTLYDVAETLAHEMIHARQIVCGDLYLEREHAVYKGQKYRYDLPEHEKPFENQAYGCERTVAREALRMAGLR